MAKKNPTLKKLHSTILSSIEDKMGKDIVSIDLRKVENAVASYFIICHGDSNTHATAIADWVAENVENELDERVWKVQGKENSEWIILDYGSIVLHVFQRPFRHHYNLEELWADGVLTTVQEALEEVETKIKPKNERKSRKE